jgi:hypothetical protein
MAEETQVAEAAEAAAPAVTVNDLANAYAVIDLASKRGAFQASELSAVGAVANKIKAFVDYIAAQQAPAEGEAAAEATTEAEGA